MFSTCVLISVSSVCDCLLFSLLLLFYSFFLFPLFISFLPFPLSFLFLLLFTFSSPSPFSCMQVLLASVEESNIVLPHITNTLQSLELILQIAIRVVSKVGRGEHKVARVTARFRHHEVWMDLFTVKIHWSDSSQ